jgi:hypothetical protein
MRGAVLLVVSGCYTGSPAVSPPQVEPRPAPAGVRPCRGTLELEAAKWRDHPNMDGALALAVTPFEENMFTTPMSGPFYAREAACADCSAATMQSSSRPWEIHVGEQTTILANIGARWYRLELGPAPSTRWCKHAVERPRLADITRTGRGAEVLALSTSTCTSMSMPDPKDASISETQTICGIGPSNEPSCATFRLGSNEIRPEWSQHTRMQIHCDGYVEAWHWQLPDYLGVYNSHSQSRLVFP